MTAPASTLEEINKSFDGPLLAVIDSVKLDEKIRRYLHSIPVLNLEDCAMLADDEKDVWENFCEPAGCQKTEQAMKIAAKKLWRAARKVTPNDLASTPASSSVGDEEAPLPPGTPESLQEAWYKLHHFHINGSRMMSDGLFNKTYRRIHTKPKKLEVIMLEKVRTQNAPLLDSKKGTFIQGGNVHEYEEINDVVSNTHMIYMRIRAVFTTLCYITIQDPSWFDFGSCENFCDLIMDLINRTYTGNGFTRVHPPVAFFQRAYMSMMADFCQEMRTVDTSLNELVSRKSAWQHYWTGYLPDNNGVRDHECTALALTDSVPRGIGRADNEDLDRQMREAISQARQAQSRYDRDRKAASASKPDSDKPSKPDGKGTGKDKKRKRGGWGQGQRKVTRN